MSNGRARSSLDRHSLTAELIYDTRLQTLPEGVRALIERERRLLFAIAEYEVVLEVVSGAPSGWSCVTGQLLANGAPVADAAVLLDDGTSRRTDAHGGFRTVQLRTARCRLRIRAPSWELIVPTFDLV